MCALLCHLLVVLLQHDELHLQASRTGSPRSMRLMFSSSSPPLSVRHSPHPRPASWIARSQTYRGVEERRRGQGSFSQQLRLDAECQLGTVLHLDTAVKNTHTDSHWGTHTHTHPHTHTHIHTDFHRITHFIWKSSAASLALSISRMTLALIREAKANLRDTRKQEQYITL